MMVMKCHVLFDDAAHMTKAGFHKLVAHMFNKSHEGK
jgi:hypothetical protein